MTIGHLRISFVAVLLAVLAVALVARASAFSSESEIKPNGDANAMPPAFPQHWGRPPLKQTRDLVELPGGYGRGSGTLRAWLTEKMAADTAGTGAGEAKWPAKDLTGLTGAEAKAAVLAGDPKLLPENVQIVPHDGMMTMDYR